MMNRREAARDLWRLLEPIHAVVYFSAEPLAALRSAGYRGFWMGYFAGRAAPLGPASAELVHAVFHNFALAHVRRALPDAWGFAPPEAALAARQDGAVAALRRQLGDLATTPAVARAAELAARAAAEAPMEGRPLFAANRALPEPDQPLAALWHAATLLREHRGDGHVAALTTEGVGGREAHVLHSLATTTPAETYARSRELEGEEWAAIIDRLRDRRLVDAHGALSEAGRRTKQRVEDLTDDLAAPAYEALPGRDLAELHALLRPMTAAVLAAGEIPRRSPMGLDLDESETATRR